MNSKMEKERNSIKTNNIRYNYDMEQAQAMMRQGKQSTNTTSGSVRNQDSTSSSTNVNNAQSRSLDESVSLALRGLDSAETLSIEGRLEEAMGLYETSIEALIKILNETKGGRASKQSGVGVDRQVLAERTRVALTDAETLKSRIQNQKQAQQQQQQQEQQPSKLSSGKSGGMLSSMFGTKKNSQEPSRRSKFSKSASESRIPSHNKSNRQPQPPTLPNSRQGGDSHALRPSKSADNDTHAQPHLPQPQHVKKKSNLNYNKDDPMITTIKSDMYVDSSTIKTTWSDISGLQLAKRSLQEAAILPLLRPDLYTGLRSPPRGILLYGPPGTGKTMLVRAIAHESRCILFACTASAMTSKWVGEGEKMIRTLFRMAADVAPSIIFFDEVDALLGTRSGGGGGGGGGENESSRRFKTEFMVQMEGIAAGNSSGSNGQEDLQHRTLVIGCTNCPWDIDDAVMRRFQRRIYVPLPDQEARMALWENLLKKAKGGGSGSGGGSAALSMTKRQVNQLVKGTDGFSCSDIASIANEAAFGPLRDLGGMDVVKDVRSQDVRPIQYKDFVEAIENSKRSVSNALLKRYAEWEEAQAAGGT